MKNTNKPKNITCRIVNTGVVMHINTINEIVFPGYFKIDACNVTAADGLPDAIDGTCLSAYLEVSDTNHNTDNLNSAATGQTLILSVTNGNTLMYTRSLCSGVWSEWEKSPTAADLANIEERLQNNNAQTIKWGATSNINTYVTAGIYNITGERLNTVDGLPIANSNPGHTIHARLVVLDSSINGAGGSDDKCVTQLLTLSNRTGGDGELYVRTGRSASKNQLVGGVGWEPWGKLQQNIEVGQVTSLDSYIGNGVYSGVYTNGRSFFETFVMVVINNYAVAGATGNVRSISQFKYALGVDRSFSYKTRTGQGNTSIEWGEWVDLGAATTTDIQDGTITAQKLSSEVLANISKSANGTYWTSGPNAVTLNINKNDGTVRSQTLPAATTEKAGVMSAGDKKELQDVNSRVGNNEETIILGPSDLLPVLWDGKKMVSSTVYNTWVVLLNKGRIYKCTNISYIYSRRTCNEYPALGKELVMPVAIGLDTGTFVATDETRYLVITVQTDKYDSSNYEVTAYGYGLIYDFNSIESRVSIVEEVANGTGKEVVNLKKDLHSRFGSDDRTIVLTSSDYDNIVWNGTEFTLPGSVDFNGFVVPIQPGERIKYLVDKYADNLRTTTEYPTVGSSNFIRTSTELNGDFIAQENEHYLFINAYIPEFAGYEVIIGEGAINKRTISTFETSVTRDSVGIVGKNSTEEIIFESKIPVATTDKAGIMSAEDKRRGEDVYRRVGSQSGTIILTSAEYNNIIWNGTKFVASATAYNGFVIPITPGQRVVYNAKSANNACTLQNYPTIGSSERVRTRTELNGDFIVQDNEHFLFLNTMVESHTSYTVTFYSSGLTNSVETLAKTQQPLYGKTIVCFGDSLTEFNGDDGKGYTDYLAELTQANVIRGGVGGTQLATRKAVVETPTDYLEAYGAVDISNLVKAWANNEWTAVDNAVAWLAENKSDDNSAQIERLKATPIENTDIVIVFGGTNDIANATFGAPTDTNPVANTCGGINQIIDSILSVKPDMPIYFFTPTPRMTPDGLWCDDYRTDQSDSIGSLSIPSLIKRIKECVELNHVPCCDMYNTIGVNRKNIYTYAPDGVHFKYGYSMIANKMYGFIMANRNWL